MAGEPTVFSWTNLILTPNIGWSAKSFDDFIRVSFCRSVIKHKFTFTYRCTAIALHCSLLRCSALEDQSCAAAIKVGLIGQIYISAISTSLLKCPCISPSSPSKALGIGFEFRFSLHTIACYELIQYIPHFQLTPCPYPCRICLLAQYMYIN